jgi:uncharacterized membrane protein YebE (DUF533 family)
MLDPKKLLDDLLGARVLGSDSTVRQKAEKANQWARDNPLAAGAIAAVLLGTKPGRKLAGTALKAGGLAAIAGLAYKAYQNYQSGKAAMTGAPASEPEMLPPPKDTSFHPSQAPQGEEAFALVLARAMIAAARADGHIDEEERKRIGDRLRLSGIDEDEERFLLEELERPVDLDAIIAAVRTDAQKVELYTASRLAIEPESRAERGYLDMLAGRLKLPDALVEHIEQTVSQVKV